MALKKSFDPGLTQQFTGELRRAINADGSFNVHREGVSWRSLNFYLFLVNASWPKFMATVLVGFLLTNLVFAMVYAEIGVNQLVGADTNTGVGPFASAFFFSIHTLTTVGYGSIYPRGIAANLVAGLEAMIGLMAFALATGLLFARFSRPSARIIFSKAILMAPYQGITSLQFRIANQRNNNLMEVEAQLMFMTVVNEDNQLKRNYSLLSLERDKVNFFPLTWTVVHPIDSDSPLYGKTAEDLGKVEAEFLILVKGFDDTFSQTVHARYSYRHDEIVWGARFQPAFRIDARGDLILGLDKVGQHKKLEAQPEITGP